ncbi:MULTISPECIES: HpcH/HpaI aldolase/citrate lyase family protein [Pseudomonas]|uniref:CoA ester lyase n=1 Tax=Pseudomonas salomonii TaxID=191391 RepID=A0ABS9GVQ2_9PSED|nr:MULTISPECIES: aldolase/citrate lyase family protein [Pseudomonas]AVJ38300.1 CoA ester lyase [Pseudomonas lurida]MCF5548521.1 CoA ester lyase [Pseudomonas salomonii]PRA17798.1 CoA ester lyase [Pseudomonas sp. MYb13]PRA20933.1 CoA ester lyase [Pseudomonas lurida]PRA37664.1 CoA ester lyase [Pseudomonas lurida]
MSNQVHPREALFDGEKTFPVLSVCEHFAGSEKLIGKAMELQAQLGPVFDITCDCEDGAAAGDEEDHAQMVARLVNSEKNLHGKLGVRIHDYTHPFWKRDVDVIVGQTAERIAYVTLPKAITAAQVVEMSNYIQAVAARTGVERKIPIHVLVETHGALREVFEIAGLPDVEVLDFGQMDFVSAHQGAIPASAMRSPNQFQHPLIVRAKTEMVAAAIANGVVPSHNVCLSLKDADIIGGDASRAKREFGFLRMWSIHPAQISAIVSAMQPAFEEIEDATEILCAAQDKDWGPIQYQGELHDRATYRYFWSILEQAKATGMNIPEKALKRFY